MLNNNQTASPYHNNEKLSFLEKFVDKVFLLVHNFTYTYLIELCDKYTAFKNVIIDRNTKTTNKIDGLFFYSQTPPEDHKKLYAAELTTQQYNIKLQHAQIEEFKQQHLVIIATINNLNNIAYNWFLNIQQELTTINNTNLNNHILSLQSKIINFFTKICPVLQKYNSIFIQNTIELEEHCLFQHAQYEDTEAALIGLDPILEKFLNNLVSEYYEYE